MSPKQLAAPPRRLDERRWLLAAAWLVAVAYTCGLTVADPDLWGHTLYGLRAIEQGVLVEPADPFSYTAAGARWVNHEWLSEYVFAWLWLAWGDVGAWCFRNLCVIVVFAFAALALRRARASTPAALALWVFGAESLAGFCTFVRPQLVTFACLAAALYVLRRAWERPASKWLWLVPPLTGLWANFHGGFLAGLGLQAAFVMAALASTLAAALARGRRGDWRPGGARLARYALTLALSTAATLVNPYGFELYAMLWTHLVTEQAVREWQPLWAAPQSPMYYVPFVMILLAAPGWFRQPRQVANATSAATDADSALAAEDSSRERAAFVEGRLLDALLLVVIGWQAVSHIRHVALLAAACLVLLPGPLSASFERLFPRLLERLRGPGRRAARGWACGLALAALLLLELPVAVKMWSAGVPPWRVAVVGNRNAPGVPIRAAEFMRAHDLRGNLVVEYDWGQYALWHLYPQVRVAFDGRYRTIYPAPVERDFLAFLRMNAEAPPRAALLDDYPSEMALLANTWPVHAYLRRRADWALVYADEQASLYVKRVAKYQHVLPAASPKGNAEERAYAWRQFPGGPVDQPFEAIRAPQALLVNN